MYMYMYVWNFNSHVYKNFMSWTFLWTFITIQIIQKLYLVCTVRTSENLSVVYDFFHSKFKTTGYKFGIKVVLTGTVVQCKTFLFRTDKIIKSIYYFKEENYIVTSPIPLNVCFKAS